jgi:hypothetical protein
LKIVVVVLRDLESKPDVFGHVFGHEHVILKVRKWQIVQQESSSFSFTGNVEDSCGSLEGPRVQGQCIRGQALHPQGEETVDHAVGE